MTGTGSDLDAGQTGIKAALFYALSQRHGDKNWAPAASPVPLGAF